MPFQTGELITIVRRDGLYVLDAPLVYQGSQAHGGDIIIVPRGFITDFASVPRMFRALLDVAGVHDRAAIVHDWLCEQQRISHLAGTAPHIDSVDTDGLFRRILRELGIPRVTRALYWAGVRWGALANAYRRKGWWRTLPMLLAVTLPLAPILVPYVAVVGGVQLLLRVLQLVLDRDDPSCPPRRSASIVRAHLRAARAGQSTPLLEVRAPLDITVTNLNPVPVEQGTLAALRHLPKDGPQ